MIKVHLYDKTFSVNKSQVPSQPKRRIEIVSDQTLGSR